MAESVALRREPEVGERLTRCTRCGKVEIPLNSAETWHYVRTGDGLGTHCPKHLQGWHEWRYIKPESLTATT